MIGLAQNIHCDPRKQLFKERLLFCLIICLWLPSPGCSCRTSLPVPELWVMLRQRHFLRPVTLMAMARLELMVRKSLPQKNNVKAIRQKQNNNLLSFSLCRVRCHGQVLNEWTDQLTDFTTLKEQLESRHPFPLFFSSSHSLSLSLSLFSSPHHFYTLNLSPLTMDKLLPLFLWQCRPQCCPRWM